MRNIKYLIFTFIFSFIGITTCFATCFIDLNDNRIYDENEIEYDLITEAVNDISNIGTIVVTKDETITEKITIPDENNITIIGNNHLIKATVTGLNTMGIFNENPTMINIFSNNGTLTIKNLNIHGGGKSALYNTGTLYVYDSNISLSGSASNSGGAIYNSIYGKMYIKNSNINRNFGNYGGGFYNKGTLVFENSSLTENRTTNTGNRGGGAGENSGTLFFNNSTIANNQSGEIGGGINNYRGTAYLFNSTITGNISTSNISSYGGGIGNNNGVVYAVNSLFGYNISNKNPSDIGIYSDNDINLIYSKYEALTSGTINVTPTSPTSIYTNKNNVFASTRDLEILNDDGTTRLDNLGNAIIYPRVGIIKQSNGLYTAPIKVDGEATLGGARVYFNASDFSNIKAGYSIDGENIISVGTLAAASLDDLVTKYQSGVVRDYNVVGAERPDDGIYYTVKAYPPSTGADAASASDASIYGETVLENTIVNLVARPLLGYNFTGWQIYGTEEILSTDYDFNLVVDKNYELVPMFAIDPIVPIKAQVLNQIDEFIIEIKAVMMKVNLLMMSKKKI